MNFKIAIALRSNPIDPPSEAPSYTIKIRALNKRITWVLINQLKSLIMIHQDLNKLKSLPIKIDLTYLALIVKIKINTKTAWNVNLYNQKCS